MRPNRRPSVHEATFSKSNFITIHCGVPANAYGQSTNPSTMRYVVREPQSTGLVIFEFPWSLSNDFSRLHHTYSIASHKTSNHRVYETRFLAWSYQAKNTRDRYYLLQNFPRKLRRIDILTSLVVLSLQRDRTATKQNYLDV